MMAAKTRWLLLAALLGLAPVALSRAGGEAAPKGAASPSPAVPRTWSEEDLRALEVPLVKPERSPRYVVTPDFYYRIPVRPIYRSYPVYHPSKEPAGYMEWLKKQPSEVAFDPGKLKTEADWVRAGELVFEAPIVYYGQDVIDEVHDPKWYQAAGVPLAKDGTMPFSRYVVRENGRVLIGRFSCSMCHTRVLPDGTVIQGAQGNYPHERVEAYERQSDYAQAADPRKFLDDLHLSARNAFSAPWVADDPYPRYAKLSFPEIQALWNAVPPGVQARVSTSLFHPVQVPDLIGVKDSRYLDRTGLVRQRSVGDLMRYAVLNQGGFLFAVHGDFKFNETLPPPERMLRYSDEQLYALALYLYSLAPPPNPNRFDARAVRGKAVFEREGCGRCHTPPLYTNNKLMPVDGFTVPPNHPDRDAIDEHSLGTDPGLALQTRRGTGLYKVPSLRGLWYRGPLQHSGQIATLEEWLDPRRLRDDFVSQGGFRLPGAASGAVRGHEKGLALTADDRKDLIAFLRTL
jgi:hypothetical protein